MNDQFKNVESYSSNPSQLSLIFHAFRGAFKPKDSSAGADKMSCIIIRVKSGGEFFKSVNHLGKNRNKERMLKKKNHRALGCYTRRGYSGRSLVLRVKRLKGGLRGLFVRLFICNKCSARKSTGLMTWIKMLKFR